MWKSLRFHLVPSVRLSIVLLVSLPLCIDPLYSLCSSPHIVSLIFIPPCLSPPFYSPLIIAFDLWVLI